MLFSYKDSLYENRFKCNYKQEHQTNPNQPKPTQTNLQTNPPNHETLHTLCIRELVGVRPLSYLEY